MINLTQYINIIDKQNKNGYASISKEERNLIKEFRKTEKYKEYQKNIYNSDYINKNTDSVELTKYINIINKQKKEGYSSISKKEIKFIKEFRKTNEYKIYNDDNYNKDEDDETEFKCYIQW